jgi:hypothetical protein
MLRMILAQLRRRLSRSVALVVGILVATTGFTVLTADTSAARLQATATVEANARGAYDILVRPHVNSSASADETAEGLVPPNFLSGQIGGITRNQWHAIERIPGIEVAAPIATYGYARAQVTATVDLTDQVDRAATTQVIEVKLDWRADRGLSTLADPATHFVYVTKHPLVWSVNEELSEQYVWSDGKSRPRQSRCGDAALGATTIEIEPDGSERSLCRAEYSIPDLSYDPSAHPQMVVAQLLPDGTFQANPFGPSDRLTLTLQMPMYLLLAGIDPEAEAQLVGLDHAVVTGEYLATGAAPQPSDPATPGEPPWLDLPVLATTTPEIDEELAVSVNRVGVSPDVDVAGPGWTAFPPVLAPELESAARDHLTDVTFTAADQYQQLLTDVVARPEWSVADFVGLVQAGAPAMTRRPDGVLVPGTIDALDPVDIAGGFYAPFRLIPPFVTDTAFRPLITSSVGMEVAPGVERDRVGLMLTGTFDPAQLTAFSDLAGAPLETYRSPDLTGADQASRDALGDQALAPASNPAGYLSSPPMLLTTLAAPIFREKPISAIRVRVAGVAGVDPISRERVRLAAERIQEATGLDVDITVGASLVPRTVALAPGSYGRPALNLTEWWTKKGVAMAIITATDRKSVVLFGLILVVCVLFLANAVSAAVRDRRAELAILACLGWPRRRLAYLIAGEVALVALVAGTLSAALAVPVGGLAGVSLGALHAVEAIPVALGLAIFATMVPLMRASRSRPGAAVRPPVLAPRLRWHGRRRTLAGLALANLWRTPGRTLLGALCLAIGVASSTVLASVTWVFHGAITGSLLGDAVSLQVRGVDAIAVAATILLGLVAVADVLYLNVRDRAAEFAALRATGWSDAALARLVTFEGLGIGLLGAVTGAVAGLAGAARFAGTLSPDQLWLAAALALGGALAAGAAATLPALLQRRLPVSTLLAEET